MTSKDINWLQVLSDALPTFLRKPLILAILLAVASPLRTLYYRFLKGADSDIHHLQHNGQVCHILGMLEERYPSALGLRYRIEDIIQAGRIVDTFSEQRPRVPIAHAERFRVLDVIQEGDAPDTTAFRVFVPRDVYDKHLSDVRYLVDKYKLPTRRAFFLPTEK